MNLLLKDGTSFSSFSIINDMMDDYFRITISEDVNQYLVTDFDPMWTNEKKRDFAKTLLKPTHPFSTRNTWDSRYVVHVSRYVNPLPPLP